MPTYRSYNVTSPETGNIPSSEETGAPKNRWILRFIACCVLWSVVVTVCLLSRRLSNPESAAKLGVHSKTYKSETIIPMSTALREITKHRSNTSSHEEIRHSPKNTTPLTIITASNEKSTMSAMITTSSNEETMKSSNITTPASTSVTWTEDVDGSAETTMPTTISTTINEDTIDPLNNTTPASTSGTWTEDVDGSAETTMPTTISTTMNKVTIDPLNNTTPAPTSVTWTEDVDGSAETTMPTTISTTINEDTIGLLNNTIPASTSVTWTEDVDGSAETTMPTTISTTINEDTIDPLNNTTPASTSGTWTEVMDGLAVTTMPTTISTTMNKVTIDPLNNTTPASTSVTWNGNVDGSAETTMPTTIPTTINGDTIGPLNNTTPAPTSVTWTEGVDGSAETTMPTTISTTINEDTIGLLNNTIPASTSVTWTEDVDGLAVTTMPTTISTTITEDTIDQLNNTTPASTSGTWTEDMDGLAVTTMPTTISTTITEDTIDQLNNTTPASTSGTWTEDMDGLAVTTMPTTISTTITEDTINQLNNTTPAPTSVTWTEDVDGSAETTMPTTISTTINEDTIGLLNNTIPASTSGTWTEDVDGSAETTMPTTISTTITEDPIDQLNNTTPASTSGTWTEDMDGLAVTTMPTTISTTITEDTIGLLNNTIPASTSGTWTEDVDGLAVTTMPTTISTTITEDTIDQLNNTTPASTSGTWTEDMDGLAVTTMPTTISTTITEDTINQLNNTTPAPTSVTWTEDVDGSAETTMPTTISTTINEDTIGLLNNTIPASTPGTWTEDVDGLAVTTMPTTISTTITEDPIDQLNNTTPASTSGTWTEDMDGLAVTTMPTTISTTITEDTIGLLNNTIPASTSGTWTEDVDGSAETTIPTLTTNRINADPNVHMNHSVKACDDFYEYACGAYEATNSILGDHLEDEATRRIFDQAKTLSNSGKSIPFFKYYQTCLDYEKNITEDERIKLAEDAIQNIGTVYNERDWHISKGNLTKMLSDLLLRNSAPLFDIVPDINIYSPADCKEPGLAASFILKLDLPAFQNSLFVNTTDTCYVAQKLAMREKKVNFKDLYDNYTTCKGEDFIASVRHAIEKFNKTFEGQVEEISTTLKDIVNKFYMVGHNAQNIRENHVKRVYTEYDIVEYEENFGTPTNQLNWQQLLWALDNRTDKSKRPELWAYNSDNFTRFEFFNDRNHRALNNVLLGLYAHKIYYELVVPGRDENYCKRIAIKLMERHASSLYMSSFNATELIDMKATVTNIFENLTETLESSVRQASWINYARVNTNDTELIRKIRNLTIEIPDVSYYQGDHKLNPELSEIEKQLTGNFFHDTMMLQSNYRKSMYALLDKSPNEYEQTWTHFALPYQTFGSTIHGLNKIIMPYGAVNWQAIRNAEEKSSTHLVLATLGTQIAHEIAHHFDTTGIQYSFNIKHTEDLIKCDAKDDIQIYNEYKVGDSSLGIEFYPPSNEQSIRYKISLLKTSLDGILSESVGLQLAYDTMLRLNSTITELLPWPTGEKPNKDKQFFLAWAQMHCTKKSLSPPSVSLYEDAHLPSRFGIFLAASNNEIFRNTWQCSNSSNLGSGNITSIFPNLTIYRSGSTIE